jgi:hypothetical protein
MAKIGEGHAAAMMRLGMKELRNAVNPSREGVADQEVGVFLTQTQGEIAQARGGPGAGPEQEKMTLEQMKETAKEKAPEKAKEREREKSLER